MLTSRVATGLLLTLVGACHDQTPATSGGREVTKLEAPWVTFDPLGAPDLRIQFLVGKPTLTWWRLKDGCWGGYRENLDDVQRHRLEELFVRKNVEHYLKVGMPVPPPSAPPNVSEYVNTAIPPTSEVTQEGEGDFRPPDSGISAPLAGWCEADASATAPALGRAFDQLTMSTPDGWPSGTVAFAPEITDAPTVEMLTFLNALLPTE
jgi:hypothetical protein